MLGSSSQTNNLTYNLGISLYLSVTDVTLSFMNEMKLISYIKKIDLTNNVNF